MAKLVPENIQTLLGMFKFDIDDECINDDLTCTICKNLLYDAYQSGCGCKYCRKCIVSYINDGNEYCPGGKEECREDLLVLDESVLSNAFLNKKVLKVRVRCPNESCQFASTLNQMEDHLRVCSLQPMECPYIKIGCANVRVNRDSVETHLNKYMLAHTQMLMEVVDNLKNEAGGLKELMASLREECKLKESEIWEEERRMDQEEIRALGAVVEELKGEVTTLRGQLECVEENQLRLKKLEEVVMELKGEIEIEKEESKKMIGEIGALKKEVEIEREESRKMSGEVGTLKKEFDTKNEELRKMIGEIGALKKEVEIESKGSRKMIGEIDTLNKELGSKREVLRKMIGEIDVLKKEMGTKREESKKMKEEAAGIIDGRVVELTKTVDSINKWIIKGDAVGSLWFKVEGFDELSKKGGLILSQHLYSHINGYKLRIRVDVSLSSGGYLRVYPVICKGEYDDVLSWPAIGLSVSVTVINHRTKEAYKTGTIKYENQYFCSKPIDKDNKPGTWFVPISPSDLDSTPGMIVSDCLLLLVTARPP